MDHMDSLKALALPDPEGLDDRAADNWRPLLAIAHLISPEWHAKAIAAAGVLSGAAERETKNAGTLLLEDIRIYFTAHPTEDRVSTDDLVDWLITADDLADRPWKTWRRGSPIGGKGIAKLLDAYRIKSERWWSIGTKGARPSGYLKCRLIDAWARYLSPSPDDDPPGGQHGQDRSPEKGSGAHVHGMPPVSRVYPVHPVHDGDSPTESDTLNRQDSENTIRQHPVQSCPPSPLEELFNEPIDEKAVTRTLAEIERARRGSR
jgi:hypothetical protein